MGGHAVLIAGLVLFLGLHSVRIVADDWRTTRLQAMGEKRWKGLYSLASAVGLVLIVWGYGLARQQPVTLYTPPLAMRHAASLFTVLAFVLITAAYVPRNHLKAWLGHPMVVGTKLWAFGHLLANGTLADVLLFGGFLSWAVVLFRSARARDRRAGPMAPATPVTGAGDGAPTGAGPVASRAETLRLQTGQAPSIVSTLVVVAAGVVGWAVFALALHGPLIGVRPFG